MNSDTKPVLAIVSDAVYPYNKGGKETRIRQLSTRMARRGWDVHIYTMHWWKEPEETRVEEGVTLHAICPLYPLYSGGRRSIRQGVRFGLSCLKLMRERFDIAEVDSMPYFPVYAMRLVTWLRHKPMAVTWHEVWPKTYWKEYLGDMAGAAAFAVERYAARLPHRIVAVSPQTRAHIHQYYGRTRGVELVESGIDTAKISGIKPAKRPGDVVYAGRLLAHKHVDVLLEAFAKLLSRNPKLKLWIIGEGPERNDLEAAALNLGIGESVEFRGFYRDIADLYAAVKAAKVFVLPSSREGFGLSVLEANACGVPVVTVDHPQNYARKLVLKGKSGEVCRLEVQALSRTIGRVLYAHTIYRKHALENAKGYDWEKQTDALDTLYRGMMSGKKQPAGAKVL